MIIDDFAGVVSEWYWHIINGCILNTIFQSRLTRHTAHFPTSFNGSRAILSGPAGGVVGYAQTTYRRQTELAVIGFDMGGTSTDVSRFDGRYEHVFESTTAGVVIQAPQVGVFGARRWVCLAPAGGCVWCTGGCPWCGCIL